MKLNTYCLRMKIWPVLTIVAQTAFAGETAKVAKTAAIRAPSASVGMAPQGASISRAAFPASNPGYMVPPNVGVSLMPRNPMAVNPQALPQQANTAGGGASNNMGESLMSALKGLFGGGGDSFKDDPPEDPVKGYSDDHIFASGYKGAGNIGTGLCSAENSGKTQVTRGYCKTLIDLMLHDSTSCAYQELDKIVRYQAGNSGDGIGTLHKYCSQYGSLPDINSKKMAYVQIVAGLITHESGWDAGIVEKGWYKDGRLMQGKGLMQIGEWDNNKRDCERVNASTIKDPEVNLRCGTCIVMENISKDQHIGGGSNDNGSYGAARYFGPFRNAQAVKRNSIADATDRWCEARAKGAPSSQVASLEGNATH